MQKVVGVTFRGAGKAYYFDPLDFSIKRGDNVIVETARGVECGEVTLAPREIPVDEIVQPLKPIVRLATDKDLEAVSRNREKEKEAFSLCQQKIHEHKLDMKLVDVEYTFDNSKVLFYFTADGRVDFRELVKSLASQLRTRIELRQIGVRDESKLLGGLGICGRPFCCSQFLNDFHPVSIKMAKEQGMSLNPTKISGSCGRLMCCLKYEQEVYEELLKITPRAGSLVKTPDGNGTVCDVSLLGGTLKVRLSATPDAPPRSYAREQVKVLRDAKANKAANSQKQPSLENS